MEEIRFPPLKRIIHEAKGVFADGLIFKESEERFGRKCHFCQPVS
jgi:hypothetical protein